MKTKFIYALLCLIAFTGVSAQNSQVLYFMNLPQNHLLNPAFRSTNRIYVGIPGLTGFNLNITNNFMSFSDIFSEGQEVSESTIPFINSNFDVRRFLKKVKKMNYLEPQASLQLIGLGFNAGKDLYVFLDVTERMEVNVVFPGDMIRLAIEGNDKFAGQTLDLSAMKTDAEYYREIGIGFSKEIAPRLRIGAKGKLLFGIAAGSFRNNVLNLTVNNDLTNRLVSDMSLSVSGPVSFPLNSGNQLDNVRFDENRFDSPGGANKFLTNTRNAGAGLDLGAEYTVNERIVVSASVTDLGFIRWKTDITNLKGHCDTRLEGLDFADIRNGSASIEDLKESLADSLKNAFTFSKTQEPFTTFLPFGIAFGGKFNVTDKFSVGLLSYSRKVDNQLKEALTVSANFNLGSILSTGFTYTASNHSYNNLGLGFGVRGGFAQFYLLVDRVPLTWSRVKTGDGTFPMPSNWNTIHTRFGLNLVFGNKAVKKTEESEEPVL